MIRSIRRYLLKSVIIALFFGSLLVSVFTYINAAGEINELYDKNMEDIALSLQSQIGGIGLDGYVLKDTVGPSLRNKIIEEQEFLIQVWSKNGQSVYTSHRAIPFPLQDKRGMFITLYKEREWRVYVSEASNFIVQVAQPQKARNVFIREMAFHILFPLLAEIPVVGLFIWLAVGRSLNPLGQISAAIHTRSASSLEPLDDKDVPAEVQPMVQELNHLLKRLQESLEAQARFTADAAHELRTPLTALQLQLDILARADTAEKRAKAMSMLQRGIDRATQGVRQLLTLARLEPDAVKRPHKSVDLAQLVKDSILQHAPLAIDKKISLHAVETDAVLVNGDADSLRILIDNLIDNAIRYTPENGYVEVRISQESGRVVLAVEDSGIGIAESERAVIFERFYRVVGTSSTGTGLGLSIVRHIASQHGANVSISNGKEGKGSVFTVTIG